MNFEHVPPNESKALGASEATCPGGPHRELPFGVLVLKPIMHLPRSHFGPDMPKRRRTGVWRSSSSSASSTSSMAEFVVVDEVDQPTALSLPSAAAECPLMVCLQCSWRLAFADHTIYQKIIDRYEEKIAKLLTSSLSSDERCSRCASLNAQLMAMERALYDRKFLGEDQVLHRMTTLRTTPRADAPWGMIRQPAASDGAVSGSAAAAVGAAAADADEQGGSANKKKKKNKNEKPTLAAFQKYTDAEWTEYDAQGNGRLEWQSDLQYEVMVETDDDMQAYPVDLQPLLMKSYWDGARSIEVAVKMESGRHAGHTHTYSVWWIGGNEGMQFNPVRSDAKARRVSIITKKVGELHWQQTWDSSAPAASSWSGGWRAT